MTTNNKTILSGAILCFALLFSVFIISTSSAQNVFDIQFPIPELGNCGSMEECKIYCDDQAHIGACTKWAKDKGLIKEIPTPPPDEFQRKTIEVIKARVGPGGCQGMEQCNAFCSNPDNRDECFRFAKENGLLPPEEIQRMEKEMSRTGPGGCRSREECDAFCRNPNNAKTCLDFAVSEGKISQEEADFMLERMTMGPQGPGQPGQRGGPRPGPGPARGPGRPAGPTIDMEKAEQLMSTIGGPGGCRTMQECDAFCSRPENDDTCFNYAVENELMSQGEIKRIQRMRQAVGPGGCRGRECEAYCDNPEHGEECLNFAIEQGFIQPEEAEQARKFMELGKRGGPGGCKGPQECDAFCSKPENREICFNFAKENNLMPPEEIQRIERERRIVEKLDKQGGGPGGCRAPEECRAYCGDPSHFDECAAFAVKEGMMKPEDAKMKLREFVDVEERKFEKFGPPGFGPQGPMRGPMGPKGPGQRGEFGPPAGEFGPPPGFEQKFKERFKIFEQYHQEFKQREEFCSKPENAEQCQKMMMPPMPMPMQPGEFPTPKEFPGKPGEFPGKPGEFPPPTQFPGFQEEGKFMPPEGTTQFMRPGGEGMMPPMYPQPPEGLEGMMPPQRPMIPMTPEQQQMMQQKMEQMQMMPPEGPQMPYPYMPYTPPSGEMMSPPAEMMAPPPSPMPAPTETAPPPPPTEPPQSRITPQSLFGILLYPISSLLR